MGVCEIGGSVCVMHTCQNVNIQYSGQLTSSFLSCFTNWIPWKSFERTNAFSAFSSSRLSRDDSASNRL